MAKTVHVFFLILVLHVLESALANKFSSFSHADDCSLLFQFKESMSIDKSASGDSGAYPKVASWNLNGSDGAGNCCLWDGVECRFGHVIGLDLSSSFLYGPIDSDNSLFNLIHLRTLNLADNDFRRSQIPSGIGQLSELANLNLSYSVFSGEVPKQFSQLMNLVSLDLSRNRLKMQRSDFQNLVQNSSETLRELSLSDVNIDSELPTSIWNLTHLNILDLRECAFTGTLPASISNLTQLTALDLSGNKLTGRLPSLESLSDLTYLDLSYNNFDRWKLPDWFGKLNKITHLYLSDVNLYGEIPSSLFNLTQVEELYLSRNQLKGELPISLFLSLKKLENLNLNGNNISLSVIDSHTNGTQPQFTRISLASCNLKVFPEFLRFQHQLEYLNLDNNNIEGLIPGWMWNISKNTLSELSLAHNLLIGFEKDSPVASWVNLRLLDLSHNMLHGSIPVPPPTTGLFSISNNQLTGEIPPSICDLLSLWFLDLSSNNITGSIPPCLKKSIQIFSVSNNRVTGEIPPSICDLLSLQSLDLSFNNITGSIPPCLKKSIEFFLVSNNRLTGEIPPSICDLLSLQWLDLSFNNISGLIPPCLKKLSNSLVALNLKRNTFQGTIPNIFTNESKYQMIDLSENKLQGQVPRSLENCETLQILDLGYNLIEDMFPFWLGSLPELRILILSFNKFHGTITIPSKNKVNFPKLHIIDLSYNSFSGDLPHQYFQEWSAMKETKANANYMETYVAVAEMSRLISFSVQMTSKGVKMEYVRILNAFFAVDLSSNMFSGKIPESIKTLTGLKLLNLSNNELSGAIPPSMGNLISLESLDLSSNKLSGMIPPDLVQLNFLAVFNVSNNNLTGPIPHGKQFDTFLNNSYIGNPALCGFPLSKKCGNSEASKPPKVSFEEDTESDFPNGIDWVVILIGAVTGLVIGLFCGDYLSTKYYKWFSQRSRR